MNLPLDMLVSSIYFSIIWKGVLGIGKDWCTAQGKIRRGLCKTVEQTQMKQGEHNWERGGKQMTGEE